jgi:hypothetical protein
MKLTFVTIGIYMITSNLNSQTTGNTVNYLDLIKIKIEKNSDLFKIDTIDNEQVLILTGNIYNQGIDEFTGKKKDDAHGKVILFGDKLRDYSMTVDMKFVGFHDENFPTGGWFGFALRAQDVENYEVVWFMPGGGGESNRVAYVPVAHGIVPWWTEAYDKQEKGNIALPQNDWFTARVDVKGDEFSVYVNDQFVFKKKMTYYLTSGKPGLYVGTATDIAVRRIKIDKIEKE